MIHSLCDATVIIIGHRPELFPRAVESVKKQTNKNIQLLGNLTEHRYKGKTNLLFGSAIGRYLIFLCDDDRLSNTYIEKCVAAADNEKVPFVFTDKVEVMKDRFNIGLSREWKWEEFSTTFSCPIPGTYLISKELFFDYHGFDEGLPYADWDFPVRICRDGVKAYHVQQPLFEYFVHENQDSNSYDHVDLMTKFFTKHQDLAKTLTINIRHHLLDDPIKSEQVLTNLRNLGIV